MPEVKIILEVDDKGTVKVKKFTDETKKAFDETKKGAEQAKGPLDSLRESWIGVTAQIGIIIGTLYAAKRLIYDTGKEIASAGNEIQRMARNLNMSTDDFQRWSYVARMADIDVQEFGASFKFLTRAISEAIQGSGDSAKAFNILGITLKDNTGKTKDQQTVLVETIGALEKYADGVNRDALMLAIFGRAFMSVKPLIDQGTKAIEENKKEAERLSLILGKDVIKSLSESEDAFKKWESVWKASKIEFWTPMVKTFTDLLETILKIKGALSGKWEWTPDEEGAEKLYQYLKKIGQLPPSGERGKWEEQFKMLEEGPTVAPAWVKEWVAGWNPPKTTKPEAPGIAKPEKLTSDEIKEMVDVYEELNRKASEFGEIYMAQAELVERGWSKEKDIVALVREELERLEREANEWGEGMVARQELIEAGWKKAAEELKKSGQTLDEMGKTFGNTLISNMVALTSATEDWGEKFKSVGTSILQTTMQIIAKQLIMNALFENSAQGTGFLSKGSEIGSIVSWIGKGLLGSYQTGMDYVPKTGAYWLHEGEKVTSKGGGGNTYNIDARGAQRGVSAEIMRAIRASENRAVIRSVNQVVDNKMRGGRFAKIFES